MRRITAIVSAAALAALVGAPVAARAADGTPVDAATRQVGDGARKVGDGQVLQGFGEMAKGVGNTVVEGARFTGLTLAETGERAWDATTDVAVEVGKLPGRLWQRLRTF